MNNDMAAEEAAFETTLINVLALIGRLADSDDERLRINAIAHDMQNTRVELDAGNADGAGNCVVYLMESDGAAIRLATQGANPIEDYRDFGIAGDAIGNDLNASIRSLLPKIIIRAGRDTTRNMNVTLAMFEEKA